MKGDTLQMINREDYEKVIRNNESLKQENAFLRKQLSDIVKYCANVKELIR
ncbi:MAG: hypothetical protein Q8936_08335 [Bacillota bacterium]|nr:hypothetical protein [Bacillota bacterium]